MDHLRAIRLTSQIETQNKIKAQFEKEGNEVGAKRAERKIKQLQKELDNIV